jgi:chemotaxis response regulator CheB
VIGIGGSAGSTEALQRFFEKMPVDSGWFFVVIVHLLPTHESGADGQIGLLGFESLRTEAVFRD